MFQRISRAVRDWRATIRTEDELSGLSDAQLRDIGIVRGQITDVARSHRFAAR